MSHTKCRTSVKPYPFLWSIRAFKATICLRDHRMRSDNRNWTPMEIYMDICRLFGTVSKANGTYSLLLRRLSRGRECFVHNMGAGGMLLCCNTPAWLETDLRNCIRWCMKVAFQKAWLISYTVWRVGVARAALDLNNIHANRLRTLTSTSLKNLRSVEVSLYLHVRVRKVSVFDWARNKILHFSVNGRK